MPSASICGVTSVPLQVNVSSCGVRLFPAVATLNVVFAFFTETVFPFKSIDRIRKVSSCAMPIMVCRNFSDKVSPFRLHRNPTLPKTTAAAVTPQRQPLTIGFQLVWNAQISRKTTVSPKPSRIAFMTLESNSAVASRTAARICTSKRLVVPSRVISETTTGKSIAQYMPR